MAVYTNVCTDALRLFLSQYDIGGLVCHKGISEGIENTNYLVETTGKRYILTIFEKRVNPNDLPFFMDVKNSLSSTGFLCPQPIKSIDGNVIVQIEGKPAVLVSFLEGKSVTTAKPVHAQHLGKAIADMHTSLEGFDTHLIRANDLSIEAWRNMWRDLRPKCDKQLPAWTERIDLAIKLLDAWEPQTVDLARGVIHADLFMDNVFFCDTKFGGFIDFYFACTDILLYDLAIAIVAWAFDETADDHITYRPEIGANILQAYHAQRPLTLHECAALPILLQGAALRFFLTRLEVWGETPAGAVVQEKDPLPFAQRLAFAMQAKSLEDYGFTIGN